MQRGDFGTHTARQRQEWENRKPLYIYVHNTYVSDDMRNNYTQNVKNNKAQSMENVFF